MPLCLISSIYKLHCFDFIFILQVKCVPKKKKSRDHLQNKNMLSKFLYRRSASISLKNEKNTMNICILHCLIDLYMEIRFTVNVCRSTLWCWTSCVMCNKNSYMYHNPSGSKHNIICKAWFFYCHITLLLVLVFVFMQCARSPKLQWIFTSYTVKQRGHWTRWVTWGDYRQNFR